MDARRIMFTDRLRVELRDFDVPTEGLGPCEVLIRTKVTLLSGGTEGAWFRGLQIPGRVPNTYPFPTGYANIGEVMAVGGPDAGVSTGDTVYTMGNHASIVRMDAAQRPCLRVPADLPIEEAIFARLITVPLATVRTSFARAGDRAAVVGLGLVGNLGAQVLQAAGLSATGVDLIESRRELARSLGITRVVDPSEVGAIEPVHRLVLEASGTAKGAVTAMALAQLGGEVSLVGTPWAPDPSVPSKDILESVHVRYLTLRSGWEWQLPIGDVVGQPSAAHQPGSVVHSTGYAFELLRQGKVRVRELITHNFSPEDCQRAYEGAVDRKSDQLGVIFHWK